MSAGRRRAGPSRARRPSPRGAAATRSGLSSPGVSATASSTRSLGHVVVHHHVGARDEDALEPALEDRRSPSGVGRPGAGTSTASDSQDRRRRRSPGPACRSVLPVSTTSAITSATPSWIAVSTAPSRRITLGLDAALLEVTARPRRRTTWRSACRPGRRRRGQLAGTGRRTGTWSARSRAAGSPRPWRPSRAAGRGR